MTQKYEVQLHILSSRARTSGPYNTVKEAQEDVDTWLKTSEIARDNNLSLMSWRGPFSNSLYIAAVRMNGDNPVGVFSIRPVEASDEVQS